MKKRWIAAGALLIAGIVMLALPLHMQMTGLVLLALALVTFLTALFEKKSSPKLRTALQILVIVAAGGVTVLMAAMNLIGTSGQSDWERAKTSEYAVVLGAAVQENGEPSRILRKRMTAALEFMEQNPTAQVILSGSQGGDEPKTEALCMYEGLLEMGADPDRLILEDQSHTTRENLINSRRIMEANGGTDRPVTLITSEFHQRRAKYIADSLEMDTCPVSAKTDWFFRVNYTLREVFSFVKAVFQSGVV